MNEENLNEENLNEENLNEEIENLDEENLDEENLTEEIENLDGAERAAFEFLVDCGKDPEEALRLRDEVNVIPERDAVTQAEEDFYELFPELEKIPSIVKFAIDWEIVVKELILGGDWAEFTDSQGNEWLIVNASCF